MHESTEQFELRLRELVQRLPIDVPEHLAARAQSRATAIKQQSLRRREMGMRILNIRRYSYFVLAASIAITLPCLSYLGATCIVDAAALWPVEMPPVTLLEASILESDENIMVDQDHIHLAIVIMITIALALPILNSLLPEVQRHDGPWKLRPSP